jgi:DNA polymerase-3 subunit alpha
MSDTPEEKMEKAEFVHLHVHSMYSLLNAVPTPKELVKAAKEDGQHAMAITDAGALYGAIDFYSQCHKAGISPIIGVDAFIAPRTRHDKEMMDRPRARVVLLAKNMTGYKNLIKLVTVSNTEGFYYRPRLDQELLKDHSEGLICIVPSFAGEATLHLKNNDLEKAAASLAWYKEVYGENLYYEITHHPEILDHPELQEKIKTLAKEGGVPLVAAQDIYYMQKDDAVIRALMMKIQSGGVIDPDEARAEDFSFATQAEMKEKFADQPEALANTVKIADQCHVEIVLGQEAWKFPDYKIASGKNSDDELKDMAYAGVDWRKHDITDPTIKKRIDYELEVIKTKGYSTYFLAVGDLLREARERGIYTTIRGSVAGSYATYVLGITNVDPLEYKLPFERFLNPERPSAPDIDMDFADDRRDEIIDYAKEKYGADKVAQIGTFGTMMARAAVKDVARALGHPYATGDRISKLIPLGAQGSAMTIDKAMDIEPDLAKLYKQDSESRQVIDLAKRIEGRVRHMGVHAAGVVIAPEPLDQYVPIQVDSKTGKFVTQYEMHSVGEDGVGLLKFDFLGIKNLAILADTVKRVKKIRGKDVDIENVDVADKKTFQMLARGETMGLFQLNGTGMTSFLKQLKPSTIHDINAMVALYRPGPMESIPDYIARKHDASLVTFLDPRLEKILDRSYGVITYQDDVMMISIALAGYSWLDADKLRKAMGKKIPEVMEAEKAKLMDGFRDFGKLAPKVADKLWERIEPFAAYGFNKAHAASYGRVAYQTAYMKANYPEEYMASVLTADAGDTEKIYEIIHECDRMELEVLPPDINESFAPFSVVPAKDGEDAKIRFGLTTIKNFGEGIADAIIIERKENGDFTSLTDLLTRVHNKNLNKKSIESLIKTGALDRFEERGKMYANVDNLLGFNKEQVAGIAASQDSLFGGMDTAINELTLHDVEPATKEQKLLWEKELLGVYVSGHPLDQFKAELDKRTNIRQIIQALEDDDKMTIVQLKGTLAIAGMIENVKELLTKKGDRMAFVKLGNLTDSIEMVTFPETYETYKDLLVAGNCVAIKGKLSIRNDEPSILIDKIKALAPKETSEESPVDNSPI